MDSVDLNLQYVDPQLPQQPSSPSQHQYGTRIRSNSVLKPSARLRGQSPDTPCPNRKMKLCPSYKGGQTQVSLSEHAVFPPPNVMLHPDDLGSKVFMAIARSFMSVDNRAMTIKDLAEMTMQNGLVCQNVSAAGQAITTYIRTHMSRCDSQADHPLMLRHVLSGTSIDDALLPALYSRTGGAHCTINPETRSTNFRRGTMVWYLSRATGAPCPFTRAGIRLSDFGDVGKATLKEKKKEREKQFGKEECGQKRKRLLRGNSDPKSDVEVKENSRKL